MAKEGEGEHVMVMMEWSEQEKEEEGREVSGMGSSVSHSSGAD
jgi:hypothetical protein